MNGIVQAGQAASLTPGDEAQLWTHLQILAQESNPQSGEVCTHILGKPEYTQEDWEDFFSRYFEDYPFTLKLYEYLTWPAFWATTPDVQVNLQEAVLTVMLDKIQTMTNLYGGNFPAKLASDSGFRFTFLNAHRWIANISHHGKLSDDRKQGIFDYYTAYINNWSQFWRKTVTYNNVQQPYIAAIAAQIHNNYGDLTPLSPERKAFIASTLDLQGRYLDLWNDFSVLIYDDNGLDPAQRDFLHNYLSLLPPELILLSGISVSDFLNPGGLPLSLDGVNVFSTRVGAGTENPFPTDIPPRPCDLFLEVVAHEVNHPVFARYIEPNPILNNRFHAMIERAGRSSNHYLRNGGEGFFYDVFYEYFASIANQWFCSSEDVFKLAMVRYGQGIPYPLEHALFFADIYSLGSNQTWFYTTDLPVNMHKEAVNLHRDEFGRIERIDLPEGPLYIRYGEGDSIVEAGSVPSNLQFGGSELISLKLRQGEEKSITIPITNTGGMSLDITARVEGKTPEMGSMVLDGDSGVRVEDHDSLNISQEITLEAWIFPFTWEVGCCNNGRVLQKGYYDNQYRLTVEDGGFLFDLEGIGYLRINDWVPPTLTWTHVSGVYDGDRMYLYIDGEKKAEKLAPGTIHITTDPLYIGNKDDRLVDGFNGRMDDVRIWSIARSQAQIQLGMKERVSPSAHGLAGYWEFNEINEPHYRDSSLNSNHGTLDGTLNQGAISSSVSWMQLQATEMTLMPGKSDVFQLLINTDHLLPGHYKADLQLNSNDPDSPLFLVSFDLLNITQIFIPSVMR